MTMFLEIVLIHCIQYTRKAAKFRNLLLYLYLTINILIIQSFYSFLEFSLQSNISKSHKGITVGLSIKQQLNLIIKTLIKKNYELSRRRSDSECIRKKEGMPLLYSFQRSMSLIGSESCGLQNDLKDRDWSLRKILGKGTNCIHLLTGTPCAEIPDRRLWLFEV